MRTRRSPLLVAAVLLLASACSGGDAGDSPSVDSASQGGADSGASDTTEDAGDPAATANGCEAVHLGLTVTVPDDWRCEVFDDAGPALDGFTLFADDNDLTVTVGSALGVDPCGADGEFCDAPQQIDLGAAWPDAMNRPVAGSTNIQVLHADGEAELTVTKTSPLTDGDLAFIREIAMSVVAI